MAAPTGDSLADVYWRILSFRSEFPGAGRVRAPAGWLDSEQPRGPWAERFTAELGGARRVLDVGAGTREWHGILARMGIDAAYESADVDTRYEHEFDNFLTVDRSYDAILMLELLEHLDAELGVRFLAHAYTVLEAGGVLAISTPNPAHPVAFQQSDFTHVRPWPAHDLWGACRAVGFETVEVTRIQHVARSRRPFVGLQLAISRILAVDAADHLLAFARKPA